MIFAGSIRAVINTWHILWGRALLAGAETQCSCYTAIRGWGWASDACSLAQPLGVMQPHWPFLPFEQLRKAAKQVKIGRQRLSCTVQSSDPYFLLYNCYNQQWVLIMLLWATVPKTITAGITVQHLESFGSPCDSLTGSTHWSLSGQPMTVAKRASLPADVEEICWSMYLGSPWCRWKGNAELNNNLARSSQNWAYLFIFNYRTHFFLFLSSLSVTNWEQSNLVIVFPQHCAKEIRVVRTKLSSLRIKFY